MEANTNKEKVAEQILKEDELVDNAAMAFAKIAIALFDEQALAHKKDSKPNLPSKNQ